MQPAYVVVLPYIVLGCLCQSPGKRSDYAVSGSNTDPFQFLCRHLLRADHVCFRLVFEPVRGGDFADGGLFYDWKNDGKHAMVFHNHWIDRGSGGRRNSRTEPSGEGSGIPGIADGYGWACARRGRKEDAK